MLGTGNYPQKAGFPFRLPVGSGPLRGGSPVIADIGITPGHKSIIFGTQSGNLYCVKWTEQRPGTCSFPGRS